MLKKYLGLFLLMVAFVSCDKFVEPKGSEIDGDLKGCFELTGEKYQYSKEGDEGVFTVTVRRTDQSVPYAPEVISTFSDDAKEQLYVAGFGYTLYDKDGSIIEEVKADKANLAANEVVNILKLKAGEEGQLSIRTKRADVPVKVALTTGMEFCNSGKVVLEGAIGRYGVKNTEIEVDFQKNEITGKYQYKSSPAGAFLWWKGKIEPTEMKQGNYEWKVTMTESNDRGGWSGDFTGSLTLSRASEKEEYHYSLPGDFTNSHFDTFRTDLNSPVLSDLYKSEEK
ncbi:MAG: hypothetical protein K2N05_04885 [Muribaculaceae bacterium]|nr:hypothetical protein [Muribaculaceae bacterium]